MPRTSSRIPGGSLFRYAVTPVARTYPSWVSLLTGTEPRVNGVRHMFPTLEVRRDVGATLFTRLRDQGYFTFAVSDFAGDVFPGFEGGFETLDTPRLSVDTLAQSTALHRSHLEPRLSSPANGAESLSLLAERPLSRRSRVGRRFRPTSDRTIRLTAVRGSGLLQHGTFSVRRSLSRLPARLGRLSRPLPLPRAPGPTRRIPHRRRHRADSAPLRRGAHLDRSRGGPDDSRARAKRPFGKDARGGYGRPR